MPLFKNDTEQTMSIVVNGNRKNVGPGETISGPSSLCAVTGLTVIIQPKPQPILNENTIKQPIYVNNINNNNNNNLFNKVNNTIAAKYTINTSTKTNFSDIINSEIKHLEYIKNKNSEPSVSIAILTKDNLELINKCCESIFNKVLYKNIVMVIIDTGTTEQTVLDYYTTLQSKCESKNWKYKFVKFDYYNYSKNYNNVIKNNIDTDYVLLQNNDTVAINDYVTEMMQIGIMNKVGSVGSRLFYLDGTIQHDGQIFYNLQIPTHLHLRKTKEEIDKIDEKIMEVDGNTAACALIRTKDYISVYGLDEDFKDICQDVDLMCKIPHLLNKFNYCNRHAEVYHIDNATRNKTEISNENMYTDCMYFNNKCKENNMAYKKSPKNVDFSIITLVKNLTDYKDFLNSLKEQFGTHSIEIIGIPNFYNTFTSAAKGLNYAKSISSGEILIYCHEDIVVTNTWLNNIKKQISELTSNNVKIGVLGMAGITKNNTPQFNLLDKTGKILKNNGGGNGASECQFLDELCLITLKSSNLSFNQNIFTGFHYYGAGICLDATLKNMKNYSINAYCHHKSVDGSKNLNTLEKFKSYEEAAINFGNYALLNGVQSWFTTTASCLNGKISLYHPKPKQ